MLLLLGTLGLVEWLVIVAFFLLLTAATFFDRRTVEAPKWYLLGVSLIGAAVYFWPDFTFFGAAHIDAVMEGTKVIAKAHDRVVLWPIVSGWAFWQPVMVYLAAGLIYSCFEFWLVIRKAARSLGAAWTEFTAKTRVVPAYGADGEALFIEREGKQVPSTVTITYGELIKTARSQGAAYRYFQAAVDLVKEFVNNPDRFNWKGRQETQIIGVVGSTDKLSAEPKIDKLELAEHAGAWTFLWPAYLMSLILGDLIVEVFNTVADILVSISGRFVKFAFRDVFKV
jgi:hypothetical protein